jgi:hypothetical protein
MRGGGVPDHWSGRKTTASRGKGAQRRAGVGGPVAAVAGAPAFELDVLACLHAPPTRSRGSAGGGGATWFAGGIGSEFKWAGQMRVEDSLGFCGHVHTV